jgi:hypothetical protein
MTQESLSVFTVKSFRTAARNGAHWLRENGALPQELELSLLLAAGTVAAAESKAT